MTMDGYVGLFMTIFDYVWPCMTKYDYVKICMTLYDYVWLQGVPIKMPEFSSITKIVVTCKRFKIFTNFFFLLKTEIHAQILNSITISVQSKGAKIFTKQNTFLKQIKLSLYCLIVASKSQNWRQTPPAGQRGALVAPSVPSNPSWLKRCQNCFHLNIFQVCGCGIS